MGSIHPATFGHPGPLEEDDSPAPPARRLAGALLLGLTLVSFFPALRAGFVWRDDQTVTNNRLLLSGLGLREIWLGRGELPRQPLAESCVWVERRVWGVRAAGYHLDGLLLHGANVLLAWMVLRRLGVPGAWTAAALFAVHPVQAEAVAWVSQRGLPLAGFFFLAATLGYLGWAEITTEVDDATSEAGPPVRLGLPQTPWLRYATTLLLFTAAVASHPVALAWPVVVLLIVWWKRGSIGFADVRPLLAFGGVALAAIVYWEAVGHFAQPVSGAANLPLLERLLLAGPRLWIATAAFVAPLPQLVNLAVVPASLSAFVRWIGLALTLAVAGFLIRRVLRRRNASGPAVALLSYAAAAGAGLLFTAVALPPNAPLVNGQYLPCLALAALAAAGVHRLARALWSHRMTRTRLAVAAAALPLGCAVMTFVLTGRYADEPSFWAGATADRRVQSFAQHRLASLALREGRPADAAEHFQSAADLDPTDVRALTGLGATLERLRRPADAAKAYADALRLAPNDPRVLAAVAGFEARNPSSGSPDAASVHYEAALRLAPNDPTIRHDYGLHLEGTGRADDAEQHYRAAIAAAPAFVPARVNLATLLFRRGHFDAAAEQLRQAVAIDPKNFDAYANAGAMLAEMKAYPDAERMLRNALAIRNDDAEVWQNLGIVLEAQGRKDEAKWCFGQAERRRGAALPD